MRFFSQVFTVTALTLRTLPQRAGSSIVAVIGVTGVVIVFVAVLSIAEGFRAALTGAGSPDTAIVMRGGSDSELSSGITLATTRIVKDAPGVQRGDGGPVASAELFVVVDVPKRSTGSPANVPLRGVEPAAFRVRDEIRIVEGRIFRPGTNEIIVGRSAANQFAGIDLGSTQRWGESTWEVVGIFEADGTIAESEIWCDARVLQPAYRRGDTFQSVFAKLDSAGDFDAFKDALTTDPRLDVMVEREDDYYSGQSEAITGIITGIGTVIALLMGIGAVFGGINTMYTAVAARTREIATLRALGFGGLPVVISVMVESVALCVTGGVIGGLLAYAGFNGYQTATINWQTFSQVAFAFAVTPALLVQGIVWAVVMGFFGGSSPPSGRRGCRWRRRCGSCEAPAPTATSGPGPRRPLAGRRSGRFGVFAGAGVVHAVPGHAPVGVMQSVPPREGVFRDADGRFQGDRGAQSQEVDERSQIVPVRGLQRADVRVAMLVRHHRRDLLVPQIGVGEQKTRHAPVAVLKRVDPDEAVVQPGGLDLGRQVQPAMALVHRQEPIHFGTHLLGRAVFVHHAVGTPRVVRPDLVASSA